MSTDEPEQTTDEQDERVYSFGDKSYPSVTRVTGKDEKKQRNIDGWRASLREKGIDPDGVVAKKALRGTLAHHRILDPISMRPQPLPEVDFDLVYDGLEEELQTCEAMWDELDYDYGENPFVEERTWSHEHGYAGTADLLTEDGTVTDLKTSKQVYSSHKMQVSAYFYAITEMDKFPDPEDAAIVVLNPETETNPSLTADVHRMDRDAIDTWFGKFIDLLETHFK